MKTTVIVAVVQLLCLQCWQNDRFLTEATQTRSLAKRIFLKSHREQLTMLNFCLKKCTKVVVGQVLINLQNCSQTCLKLLKKDLIKINLTILDPSVPPPTLPWKHFFPELQPWPVNTDVSESCRNALYQTSNNSPSPSGQKKSLPPLVDVTFSGGKHGQWQAVASWKYSLTEKKRPTRNITGYMVFWNSDSFPTELNCREIPLNQAMVTIISGVDGWIYPDVLYLTVQPIAIDEKKDIELTAFSPKREDKRTVQVSLPNEDNNLKPGQIVGICAGVIIAGVVLLAIACLALQVHNIKRSKSTLLSEASASQQ